MSPDVLAQTCTHKYLAIISFKLCHLSQLDIVIPLIPLAQVKAWNAAYSLQFLWCMSSL